jgi:hypothetical protein
VGHRAASSDEALLAGLAAGDRKAAAAAGQVHTMRYEEDASEGSPDTFGNLLTEYGLMFAAPRGAGLDRERVAAPGVQGQTTEDSMGVVICDGNDRREGAA